MFYALQARAALGIVCATAVAAVLTNSSRAHRLVERLTVPASVPLLIIDDLGMRKVPSTAAEDLLKIIMRRYERASTLITSNRPVDD